MGKRKKAARKLGGGRQKVPLGEEVGSSFLHDTHSSG
jgi:hypothetical protein